MSGDKGLEGWDPAALERANAAMRMDWEAGVRRENEKKTNPVNPWTEKETALQHLVVARHRIEAAKRSYTLVMSDCVELGLSNTKMAEVLGISETAVRKWRERHGL